MEPNKAVQTVFLIDDNEIDLFIQKRYIELSSFAQQVVTFTSPVKALEAFHHDYSKPELQSSGLIFLDLNMPILNGFEFLKRLNELSSDFSERFKVVILSSSSSDADKNRAQEFPNVISFTSKPLNVVELENINQMLGN
jgi:CheY-like chemotaxis protein